MDAAQLRPLSVGEILDLAIKIYRQRFVAMAKAVAVVVAPVAVVTALVQLSLSPDSSSSILGPIDATGQPNIDGGELWSLIAGFLAAGTLAYIAAQLATAASFKLVAGAYLDEPPDWRGSLSFALSRLGPLLWLTFVFGVLLVLGFVACILPGFYLYVAWSVAVPVLLLEDVRGRKALKRSKQLVKGRWWSILGAIVVALILAGIVQGVFSGVLLGVIGTADNAIVTAIAGAIANTAASVLTTPFTAAVIMGLYFDLRVRKEGFDLELLARRVGVEPPPGALRPDGGGPLPWPAAGTPAGPAAGLGSWPPPGDSQPGGDPERGDSQPPFWPPPPGWRPDA